MKLLTKSEFSRLAGVSPAAINKAIKLNRLEVVGEGRKAKINPDCYKSIQYLKANNNHRSTPGRIPQQNKSPTLRRPKPGIRKPKKEPVKIIKFDSGQKQQKKEPIKQQKKQDLKIIKNDKPAGPTKEEIRHQAEIDRKIEILEDLGQRYDQARTEKLEQQALNEKLKNARIRGELIDREKVYNSIFTYLDKLHSNLERLADSYLSDVGPLIIDAGKIMPEHRSSWKNEVMSQIDESKKVIIKNLKKIQKEQTK